LAFVPNLNWTKNWKLEKRRKNRRDLKQEVVA
jgi:hypothetical protein